MHFQGNKEFRQQLPAFLHQIAKFALSFCKPKDGAAGEGTQEEAEVTPGDKGGAEVTPGDTGGAEVTPGISRPFPQLCPSWTLLWKDRWTSLTF